MMTKVLAALAATTMIAGATLVAAPAATAASTATTVEAWYADFLSRDADADAGSRYWVDQIDADARASDQVWAITHSEEYHRNDITFSYAISLGREPDAGAHYWLEGANAQRFPLEWVAQNVAASPEAVAAANGRGDLIATWYYTALSAGGDVRIPSPGEVAYWQGRVRAVGALGAYRELYYTPEAISYRVEGWYLGLLNREPSPGEVAYWYPKEVESDINVGVLIASTDEYANHADQAG